MLDRFSGHSMGGSGPAMAAFAVVPHDTNTLPERIRGLYVGASGNIAVQLTEGTTTLFSNCQAGTILPVRAVAVLATGTTAANLVGLV